MRRATCSAGAHAVRHAAAKGATLQHPGWADTSTGFQPFPIAILHAEQAVKREAEEDWGR
jgi:hypothetical protein